MYLTIKNCLSIYIVYFYVYRLVLPKRPREWTLLLTKFVKTKNQTLIIDILQPKIYQLKYFLCNFDGNHIHTLMTPFAASLCQLMIPLPSYMASRYNCKVASIQICSGRRGLFLLWTALVVAHWRLHIHNRNKRNGVIVRARHMFVVRVNSKRRKDENASPSGDHRPEVFR